MSLVWREHSLDDPAENQCCGNRMEALVTEIGRDLKPGQGCECTLEEIVRRVCCAFHLKPPITGEKIRTFLETSAIYHEVAPSVGHTTFLYNRRMSRWEIHTRPCATYEWSREVWHEVWEILFWRCFHRITWWKTWAARHGYNKPHDKADEFAFLLLLSSQSVPAQAKKRHYDLYEVAKYYGVPTNLAFRALQSYPRFSHPVLLAVLRLNVPPPVQTQPSPAKGLFEEYDVPADAVYAEVYHKANRPGPKTIAHENLQSAQWQYEWRGMKKTFAILSEHLRRGNTLRIASDDPIYGYCRQAEPKHWTVPHLFGADLVTEVSVITRQSPRSSNEIFLQVVPPGNEADFMPGSTGLLDVALRVEQLEWQRAARSIKKRQPTLAILEGAVLEEEDPFQWPEAG